MMSLLSGTVAKDERKKSHPNLSKGEEDMIEAADQDKARQCDEHYQLEWRPKR